jgi:hypothetical protein
MEKVLVEPRADEETADGAGTGAVASHLSPRLAPQSRIWHLGLGKLRVESF